MSYQHANALQVAVYGALQTSAAVQADVAGAVYDAVPAGPVPPLYVILGEEEALARDDMTGTGALHKFTVSVVGTVSGFADMKVLAGAICDALTPATVTLSDGHLISLNFERARARRLDGGAGRQIDLRFNARIEHS